MNCMDAYIYLVTIRYVTVMVTSEIIRVDVVARTRLLYGRFFQGIKLGTATKSIPWKVQLWRRRQVLLSLDSATEKKHL